MDDSDSGSRESNSHICHAMHSVDYLVGPCLGLAANRNAGLDAIGDVEGIAFIDDDVRVSPDFVRSARALLQLANASDSIMTGWELRSGERITPHNPSFLGHQNVAPASKVDYRAIVINATLFPSQLFEYARFATELRYGSEEVDICAQALSLGFIIQFADSLWNFHDPSEVNRRDYQEWIERSRIIAAYRRHHFLRSSFFDRAAFVCIAPAHLGCYAARNSSTRRASAFLNGCNLGLNAVRTARRTLVAGPHSVGTTSSPGTAESISVIVPSHLRTKQFRSCLDGLEQQIRSPEQIVAVVRDGDLQSTRVASEHRTKPTVVTVNRPGQVEALNAGLAIATGSLVAITDDDAVPRADWLFRIESCFATSSGIGAVGGRDVVHIPELGNVPQSECHVGTLTAYGRVVGNHHIGSGRPRKVDFLKGVNMSFRRRAIRDLRFERSLRGEGAQIHNDMLFSLSVGRRGWDVIYDPNITVDHYPGQRAAFDDRLSDSAENLRHAAYNQTLAFRFGLSRRRALIACSYALAVGYRNAPGILVLGAGLLSSQRRSQSIPNFANAMRGRIAAILYRPESSSTAGKSEGRRF